MLRLICGSVYAQNYNDSLLLGAWSGDKEKVRIAILNKADINYVSPDSVTALHYACASNSLSIVQMLISCGANPNSADINGLTPLHVAAEIGADSIGELLILNGAVLDKVNKDGYTPLMVAVSNGNYVFCDLCLFYGSDLNIKSKGLSSVCHLAVIGKNPYLLQMLINKGAEVNSCNILGRTPLDLAVILNDTNALSILLRSGALLNLECSTYSTEKLLHDAINNGCDLTIPIILAVPDIEKQCDLKSLRDYAIRRDNQQVRRAFRNSGAGLSWRPIFNGVSVRYSFLLNTEDHFFNYSVGTTEMKSKIGLDFGFGSRIWPKRVLYDFEQQNETLQLFERRRFFQFRQYKIIRLNQNGFSGIQAEIGLQQLYSYASFKGMFLSPWQGWRITPTLDFCWYGRIWSVSAGVRYFDFNNNLPKFYYSLSGAILIPFKK